MVKVKLKIGVAADTVLFTIFSGELHILLTKRDIKPYNGSWVLPGGKVEEFELLEEGAKREFYEETGLKVNKLQQLHTFDSLKRDPRSRVIGIAFYGVVPYQKLQKFSNSEVSEIKWFDVNQLPKLGFDHTEIVKVALQTLKEKVEFENLSFKFLKTEFTLTELQEVFEVILGCKLDKRNFRKKLYGLNILKSVGKTRMGGAHRPAKIYFLKSFKTKKFIVKGSANIYKKQKVYK